MPEREENNYQRQLREWAEGTSDTPPDLGPEGKPAVVQEPEPKPEPVSPSPAAPPPLPPAPKGSTANPPPMPRIPGGSEAAPPPLPGQPPPQPEGTAFQRGQDSSLPDLGVTGGRPESVQDAIKREPPTSAQTAAKGVPKLPEGLDEPTQDEIDLAGREKRFQEDSQRTLDVSGRYPKADKPPPLTHFGEVPQLPQAPSPAPAAVRAAPESSPFLAFLASSAAGATLSGSNYALGSLEALRQAAFTDRSYSDAYAQTLRDLDKLYEDNPASSLSGNITGVALPLLVGGTLGGPGGAAGAGAAALRTLPGLATLATRAPQVARIIQAAGGIIRPVITTVGAPARTVAGIAERAVHAVGGAAPASLLGALGYGMLGGGIEGGIGGAITGGLNYLRPGYTAKQAAEDAVTQGTVGGLFNAALGGLFGPLAYGIRAGRNVLKSILPEFDPRPLPEVKRTNLGDEVLEELPFKVEVNDEAMPTAADIPRDSPTQKFPKIPKTTRTEENVEQAVQRMSKELQEPPEYYVRTPEEHFKNDPRGKYEREVYQVRLAKGEGKQTQEKLGRRLMSVLNKMKRASNRLESKIHLAAKKEANKFDEKQAHEITLGRKYQRAQQEKALKAELDAQSAADQVRGATVRGPVRPVAPDFDQWASEVPEGVQVPGGALDVTRQAPPATPEQLAEMAPPGAADELFSAPAPQAPEPEILGAPPGALDELVEPSPAQQAAAAKQRTTTPEAPEPAPPGQVEPEYSIPGDMKVSRELFGILSERFAGLKGSIAAFRDAETVAALKNAGDYAPFLKAERQLPEMERLVYTALSKGKVGSAFSIYDQGVKAFLGRLSKQGKRQHVGKFFQNLADGEMRFLDGVDAQGNVDPSNILRRSLADAQPAIARVLQSVEDVAKDRELFHGSPMARDAVDGLLAEFRQAISDGKVNKFMSKQYLDVLRNDLEEITRGIAMWDLDKAGAVKARGELQEILAKPDLWEAPTIAARQFAGNKPWATGIKASQDQAFKGLYTDGPRPDIEGWNNQGEASSERVMSLIRGLGDPAQDRAKQGVLYNVKAIAADAHARSKAWGRAGTDADVKEIVESAIEVEDIIRAAEENNFETGAGEELLKLKTGDELMKAAIGGAATSVAAGPVAGAVAFGARAAKPQAKKQLLEVLAESQSNAESSVARLAKKAIKAADWAGKQTEGKGDLTRRMATGGLRLVQEDEVRKKDREAHAVIDPTSAESELIRDRAATIEQVSPELADAYAQLEKRRAAYIAESSSPTYDPSGMRAQRARITAAYHPERTARAIAEGTASHFEKEAFQAIYPESYQRLMGAIQKEAEEHPPTSRAAQTKLYQIAGVTTRSTMDPQALAAAQNAAGGNAQPTPVPLPPSAPAPAMPPPMPPMPGGSAAEAAAAMPPAMPPIPGGSVAPALPVAQGM